ncbi:MAG: hypothetical protein ACRDYZ_15365 [Acidimicrobiales bacterium]
MAIKGTVKGIGQKIRRFPGRLVARTPWLRRRYVRRMLRTIDRAREKSRPLPESLIRVDRMLRRVPKPKRAEALEQMLEAGSTPDTELNRALRRASGRQDRQSGKNRAGTRPGISPGQRVEQRRR